MAEIQSLVAEVNRLTSAINFWNTVRLVMGVAILIATIGVVVSQYIAGEKSKRLGEAQGQLGAAKEKRLALELKVRDEQISEANARGEEAKAAAAEANERAAQLDKDAATLRLELARRTQPLEARTISPKQAEILKEAFTGRSLTVGLMCPTPEYEAVAYAKQLRDALVGAGVHIGMEGGPSSEISVGGETLMGNGLSLISGPEDARKVVIDAFSRAGIPFTVGVPPGRMRFGYPVIVIGSRPPLPNSQVPN